MSAPNSAADRHFLMFQNIFLGIFMIFKELFNGVRTRSLPFLECFLIVVVFQAIIFFKIDYKFILNSRFYFMYPQSKVGFVIYYSSLLLSPFLIWAFTQVLKKKKLSRRLTEVFSAGGLKNNLGNLPQFIFDNPLDKSTRKLRLTNAILPLLSFEKAKGSIESGLQIFIDEIKENRVGGTVDIIYAHEPMPSVFKLENIQDAKANEFFIGTTRSKVLKIYLEEVPHLLVAGQTGGGKSTFLRQFIATQYLCNKKTEFTLIDLKGGLEFDIFENLKRIKTPQNISESIADIQYLAEKLQKRMKVLKHNKCKDIEEFIKIPKEKISYPPDLPHYYDSLARHIIVVDEAAEMFLASHLASGKEVQNAKKILSQIARQGRASGIHLVVATQRPDSRALDPQIKANLTGILCFQMANDISSITVLGNGRATDLPPIAGRAIWKRGIEMVEVQTPYLTPLEAEEVLRPYYIEPSIVSVQKNEPEIEKKELQVKKNAKV
jgi:S-DNA-T family DNA segregation ATPase FtsK/SpoIIIE